MSQEAVREPDVIDGSARFACRSRKVVAWIGFRVVDVYGADAGRAKAFWSDSRGGPGWILLGRGRFKARTHTLIPCEEAIPGRGQIWVPYGLATIRAAPAIEPDPQALTAQAEVKFAEHFHLMNWPAPEPAESHEPRRREPHPGPALPQAS